ncbi:unnamed protein product [Rotaria socialis]|uniref:Uncharacterized protein n=1 Tax=Rotaria socialis TaxID=392032 RepID=A0A817YYY1_9BILA|nr:unnamed protein product [Rotaria socialis]CAF4540622.1 unnamed protein product [Rotaria socialis]
MEWKMTCLTIAGIMKIQVVMRKFCHTTALKKIMNGSLSEEESDDDDDDQDDSIDFYNPNQLTKQTGNLNAKNLLTTKKSTGKGIRDNRYTAASGSDTEANDQLAHV